MKKWMVFAASIIVAMSGSANAETPNSAFGIWKNPEDSVHVRIQPCDQRMCGVVIWANDAAKADAKRGGTEQLDGLLLFRDFVRQRNGQWRGKVFVPDIGKTFSGTITLLDDDRLEGKGCLAGKILCRSQIWTRVG